MLGGSALSRYRLSLRADNADLRLTRKGFEAGLVGAERLACLERREEAVSAGLARLAATRLSVGEWVAASPAPDSAIRFTHSAAEKGGKEARSARKRPSDRQAPSSSAGGDDDGDRSGGGDAADAVGCDGGGGGGGGHAAYAARKASRAASGGLRTKTALEVVCMPGVDLAAVEDAIEASLCAAAAPSSSPSSSPSPSSSSSSSRVGGVVFERVPGFARDTVEALAK